MSLNLNSYTPKAMTPEMQLAQMQNGKKVQKLGVTALVLAIASFIPFLGVLTVLPAFFLARYALKLSRQNLVAYDFEKFAFWAYRISLASIILMVIGIVMMII